MFNTYQHQTRTLFEGLNYFTVTNEDVEHLKDKRFDMMLPAGYKGIVFVPLVKTTITTQVTTIGKQTKQNAKKESQVNFVYIMYNRRNGYFKIGKSVDPEYREKTLQAEEPDIILIDKWEAASHIETTLHGKFKEKRKRGEWFALTDDDITIIRQIMEQLPKR